MSNIFTKFMPFWSVVLPAADLAEVASLADLADSSVSDDLTVKLCCLNKFAEKRETDRERRSC